MTDLSVKDHLQHQRWLLDNGLMNDLHKDTLYLYGTLVHPDIKAVEVAINVIDKTVGYKLYVNDQLLQLQAKYNKLINSRSLLGLWRFKRLLNKEGNLNFSHILNKFVKDYCGSGWNASVEVFSIRTYVDGFKELQESETEQQHSELDQSTDR